MDIGGGDGGGGGVRGGQWLLLCSARVGVGPLTRWLALRARGPGWQGGGAAALALLGTFSLLSSLSFSLLSSSISSSYSYWLVADVLR